MRKKVLWLAVCGIAAAADLSAQTLDSGMLGLGGWVSPAPAGAISKTAPVTCVDASRALSAVEFAGGRYDPLGGPEPILSESLEKVGEHGGIPLYVWRQASKPYVDLWLPMCDPVGFYRLYTRRAGAR